MKKLLLSILLFVGLTTLSLAQTKTVEKAKTPATPSKAPAAVKATTGPKKADGTPDMRYAENKGKAAASTGPKKADGTPDMRYAENKGKTASPAKPKKKG